MNQPINDALSEFLKEPSDNTRQNTSAKNHQGNSKHTPQMPKQPIAQACQDISDKEESFPMRHPHLGTPVLVKKNLIEIFQKQGYSLL